MPLSTIAVCVTRCWMPPDSTVPTCAVRTLAAFALEMHRSFAVRQFQALRQVSFLVNSD